MIDPLKQLQDLEAELHEVNEALAHAARPLDHLSDMDEAQRQQLAAQLRAVLARWEAVTQRISHALRAGGDGGGNTS
jgi:hypothetical protein